jgi:hypothetical protein
LLAAFVWTRREVELLRPSSPKKIKEAKIEASLISFSLRLDRPHCHATGTAKACEQ